MNLLRETPDAFLKWFQQRMEAGPTLHLKQMCWEAWSAATLRCQDIVNDAEEDRRYQSRTHD